MTRASTSFSTCTMAPERVRASHGSMEACRGPRERAPPCVRHNDVVRWAACGAVDPVKLIAPDSQGLDYRYGSSGYYGGGNYTSTSSRYSYSYSFKKDTRGARREMFICQGAFGRAQHHGTSSSATRRYMSAPAGYDSVSGDDDGTLMRIVYDHNRLYPGYSIVYSGGE